MTAVRYRFRADLRTRWRAWLGLAVVVGLFAGAITAVAAGARRTDSAFPRFLKATKPPDIVVIEQAGQEGFAHLSPADLRLLPGVPPLSSLAGFSLLQPPITFCAAHAVVTV